MLLARLALGEEREQFRNDQLVLGTAWRNRAMPTGWVVVVANGVEFEALGQLREALLKQKDLQVTDVSLTGGSAQVRAKTALSADKVGELVAGAAVGTGIAKVSRISAGRVELAVVPKP